ncbi:MAG: hypothetical protein ABI775_12810 [Pseudonocardiales bacterium]
MNHAMETGTADSGGAFDPRQAANLLTQTTLRARRQFEPNPPWLLVIRAVVALGVYGSVWLSVRGQHPYLHPTAAAIPGAVGFGIANLIATIVVAKRASAGISGKSRPRPADIAAMGAVWVAVFVVMGVLIGAEVSDNVVYGLYPATAPLIVTGLAWAALMAARADRRACISGLAAAALGAVAITTGPAGAWLVVGLGVFVLLLEHAAEIAWRQRG